MIELTERATQALLAADAAARRFNPEARIRIVSEGASVRAELADGPAPGDASLDLGGLEVFVADGVAGVVDAGDHNELTLRPS